MATKKNYTEEGSLVVYTDGGARGNPGPAAIGIVVKDSRGNLIKTYGEAIGIATNNEAEYRAVIFALEKIRALYGKVQIKKIRLDIRMDSELVMMQLIGKFKIEEERLYPLFIRVWNLRIDFGELNFVHIPRDQNHDADRMVNEALDREQRVLF